MIILAILGFIVSLCHRWTFLGCLLGIGCAWCSNHPLELEACLSRLGDLRSFLSCLWRFAEKLRADFISALFIHYQK